MVKKNSKRTNTLKKNSKPKNIKSKIIFRIQKADRITNIAKFLGGIGLLGLAAVLLKKHLKTNSYSKSLETPPSEDINMEGMSKIYSNIIKGFEETDKRREGLRKSEAAERRRLIIKREDEMHHPGIHAESDTSVKPKSPVKFKPRATRRSPVSPIDEDFDVKLFIKNLESKKKTHPNSQNNKITYEATILPNIQGTKKDEISFNKNINLEPIESDEERIKRLIKREENREGKKKEYNPASSPRFFKPKPKYT